MLTYARQVGYVKRVVREALRRIVFSLSSAPHLWIVNLESELAGMLTYADVC
jgi:hypothetical protein